MPTYGFRCPHCEASREVVRPMSQYDLPVQCDCGGKMEYNWEQHSYRPFKSFTTTAINGKPIEITSLSQLRRLEKQCNVNFPAYGDTMLGDSGLRETAWIDANGRTHYE